VKQLEDGYVRFVALSFFFLYAKFCPLWCRHVKITANEEVGRFLGHSVYCLCTITVASVMGLKLSNVQCSISNMTFLWQFPALCENLSFLSLLAHSKLPVWLYTTSRLVSYESTGRMLPFASTIAIYYQQANLADFTNCVSVNNGSIDVASWRKKILWQVDFKPIMFTKHTQYPSFNA